MCSQIFSNEHRLFIGGPFIQTIYSKIMEPVSDHLDTRQPFNDSNMRVYMARSLGLEKHPTINANVIDECTGIIAKETVLLKKLQF